MLNGPLTCDHLLELTQPLAYELLLGPGILTRARPATEPWVPPVAARTLTGICLVFTGRSSLLGNHHHLPMISPLDGQF